MEKQTIILFLLLSLLLALKGMNFADESIPVRQPLRDKLASAARHFLGLPYRWGGMSERSGLDCSGLVTALGATFHIVGPRTSRGAIPLQEARPPQVTRAAQTVIRIHPLSREETRALVVGLQSS